MGRMDNPVRRVLNRAADEFLRNIPIVYVLTVIGTNPAGELVVRGLFVGDDLECFRLASELSVQVNIQLLDRPIHKAVVYLDPEEFHSTWLGNKAIYRTRMALADNAELIVLAPGVKQFGEDPTIDRMIRRFGYHGTPATLEAVRKTPIWRPSSAPPLISSTAPRKAASTSLIAPVASPARRQKA